MILDASALLAFVFRESGAEMVAANLDGAAISTVNWAETLQKCGEFGLSLPATEAALDALAIEVVPLSRVQARIAATLRPPTRSLGLSLGDRCCLALALDRGQTVLTADAMMARADVAVDVRPIR